MKLRLRMLACGSMLLFGLAAPATAQYMKITTDNPGDPTRMRSNGSTTILTITLDTVHDRNGTTQTCNSHSAANGCGTTASSSPIGYFSYTILLKVPGGTVSWGAFTPADPTDSPVSGFRTNDHAAIIDYAKAGLGAPAGLSTVGTLSATGLSGSPSIAISDSDVDLDVGLGTTFFGTFCDASSLPNSYALGKASDPCGRTFGIGGDWFDWDGVAASIVDDFNPPTIAAPAAVSGAEGTTFSITATAADADPGDILTITASGVPPFGTFSTTVRPSPTTATIALAPGSADAGATRSFGWSMTGTDAPTRESRT